MAGKRQPTEVIKANGRKHLSQAEEDARRDAEVHVPPPDAIVPPMWLSKKYVREFLEIGQILLDAGLYAELDRDVLAQYFVLRDRWLHADKQAAKAIRAKDEKVAKEWTSIQSAYFKQARQCAESMGLSVTSRCRIVVPQGMGDSQKSSAESAPDEFTAFLQKRQMLSLAQVEA